MNLASILVDVDNDLGIVVMMNFPGDKADAAALETMKQLYGRYMKDGKSQPSAAK